MNSLRLILVRGVVLGVLVAVIGAGALLAYVTWYSGTDRIVPGVVVGGTQVGGLSVREANSRLHADIRQRESSQVGEAGRLPAESAVTFLHWQGRTWQMGRQEAGGLPDISGALHAASAIGRSGNVLERTRVFVGGAVHGHHVPLELRVGDQAITQRLELIAREVYQSARDARYDFETGTLSDELPGRELDLKASLDAVRSAVLSGRSKVDLVVAPVAPIVTKQDLSRTSQHPIARFATPVLAADPGRLQNITMAIRKISGYVLQPGQGFSFNDVVGPRDAANGWAQAKELYQGEFVWGYGGGICQVSSTLYNAVLLGGLEVKQRFHHDRPLQYVSPGRDATVAWKVLDFQFRNNTGMPVLIGAKVIPGTPRQIEVTLYAANPAPEGRVRLEDADVRYYPPEMEETLDATLPAGQRVVTDEGHYGIEVKIYRVFRDGARERRELVSHDHYRAKPGKVLVGVGNAPGAGKLLNPGLQ